MDKLHAEKHEVTLLTAQYGARRICVFGSVAMSEERMNDIDFLVDFPQGYDVFTQRLPLSEKLMELTGKGRSRS